MISWSALISTYTYKKYIWELLTFCPAELLLSRISFAISDESTQLSPQVSLHVAQGNTEANDANMYDNVSAINET